MNVAWVVLHCNRRIEAREHRQLIPHVRFQVPFLRPESQLKSGFACAGLLCRSLGDAAVFSPQGGGMLVLGAAGLFCLSGGELQAIKENRKQNRLAQKRRKNLLKADIVFCSCLFLGGSSITLRRRQRSYLVLIFSCSSRPKRRKQPRQERRSPQAPAVAVLGLLGQQSKAALNFRRLLKLLTFISSAVQHHHRSLLFLTQAHIVLCHLLVTG